MEKRMAADEARSWRLKAERWKRISW